MNLKTELAKLENQIELIEKKNIDDTRLPELEAEANNLAEEIERIEVTTKEKAEREEIERRESELKRRISSKCGDYLKWMAWAESLYPITHEHGLYTFISTACKWKTMDKHTYGPYRLKIEALEKIEVLINTKINDRNRGLGDIDEDLKKLEDQECVTY